MIKKLYNAAHVPDCFESSSHFKIFSMIALIMICISNFPAAKIRDLADSESIRISAVYIKCKTFQKQALNSLKCKITYK